MSQLPQPPANHTSQIPAGDSQQPPPAVINDKAKTFRVKCGHVTLSAIIRLSIWSVAAYIAVFPALSASHARPSFQFSEVAKHINDAGAFRDLFFSVVILATVAATNLIDNCLKKIHGLSRSMRGLAIVVLCYYLLVLVYGTSHFAELPSHHTPISPSDFDDDYAAIKFVFITSFFTEIFICLVED